MQNKAKTIIIGSGAAGLTLALTCADNMKVTLLTQGLDDSCATYYAQGGVAAALDATDTIAHIADTLAAGDQHCDPIATKHIIAKGKTTIDWLIKQGVEFKQNNNKLDAKLESGHANKRVFHITDRTGFYIWQQLVKNIRQHPNITIIENCYAFELLTTNNSCHGVYIIHNEKIELLTADNIILATGGGSGLFLNNTSKYDAQGSGIVMAYNAGCRVTDLEFVQFHPTVLYNNKLTSPLLISETLRGVGAKLKLPTNEKFMHLYAKEEELTTRNVVSLAIWSEMQKNNVSHVLLDASNLLNIDLATKFPYIYNSCLQAGIDIAKQPIPITPAAHYTCGGIVTDKYGKTDVTNLYAIGETACTGLHGANRLGSNSLLECITMGIALSEKLNTTPQNLTATAPTKQLTLTKNSTNFQPKKIQQLMWSNVGIIRENIHLNEALQTLNSLQQALDTELHNGGLTTELIKYKNLLSLAKLTTSSAIYRKESRGCHFNRDLPNKNPKLAQQHVIQQISLKEAKLYYQASPLMPQ